MCDTAGDVSPSYSDVACNSTDAASAYAGSDGATFTVAFVVAGNPLTTSNQAPFESNTYVVAIGVNGTQVATIGLNGKKTNNSDEVYAKCLGDNNLTFTQPATTSMVSPEPTGLFRVTLSVPISSLATCGVDTSTPVQLYYGTSQAGNLDVINKDYFLGSGVDYSSLATLTLGGKFVLTKSATAVDGPDPPQAGAATTYDLVLTAADSSTAGMTSVAVEDILPDGVTLVSATATAGTVTTAGQTVSWSGFDLATGASEALTMRVSVSPTSDQVGSELLLNPGATGTATRSSDAATVEAVSNQLGTAPVVGPRIVVTKAASSATVNAGDAVTYTITVENRGDSATAVTTVVDTLPTGFSYVPGSTAGTLGAGEPTVIGQDVTWTGAFPLPAGESRTLTFRATAGPSGGVFTNTATASGSDFTDATTGPTAAVTVNAVPVAADDAAATAEDTPVTVNVVANDSDPDGNLAPGTVSIAAAPANGSVAVDPATGAVTYTPAGDFNGTDTFTYQVCDTGNLCDTAVVTIDVAAVNDPPLAAADTSPTTEDTAVTIDVVANDSDVDGNLDPASVTVVNPPDNGTLTVDPATGAITYTPDGNFNGTDTFSYQVCDTGAPVYCAVATVNVPVTPVNDAPVAVADSTTTAEDTAVVLAVLANDSDVDANLDPATVTVISGPANGATTVDPATGAVTYTPAADFSGTDTFTYQVCDTGSPVLCATATATVGVEAVNDAPVVTADAATTAEDTATTVDVLANDSDADDGLDPASVTVVSGPTNGTATVDPATGAITYTPAPDFSGTDTVTYQVCDAAGACGTATVTFTVDPVNDPPVAADDAETTPEDTPVTVDVLANDSDVEGQLDPASVTVTSGPANGSAAVDPATGAITYTPAAAFNGTDALTYQVCDAAGACTQATLTVAVGAVDDPPLAGDDAATTAEDTAVVIDVAANDTDPDNNLDPTSVTVTAGPANGTVSVDPATGAVTYTPDADFNGADSFTYQICDTGTPVLCDTATVALTVDPVNDAPVGRDDSATTSEDSPVVIDVLANDSDADGDLDPTSVTVVTAPTEGTVAVDPATGEITYTPGANASGADSFTYQVCDTAGACTTAEVAVSVAVSSLNDVPVVGADTATTAEENAVLIDVLANDTDPDGDLDPASVTVVSGPTSGTTTVDPATGQITYTPDPSFSGSDSFTYQVCDTAGACASGPVDVTVTPVNDPPVVNPDSVAGDEDTPITVAVLANDADPDNALDPASVTVVSGPASGTATVDPATGSVTYTPAPDFNGTDTLTYQVCDTGSPVLCDTATVSFTVNPVNDAPTPVDDVASTPEDTAATVDVVGNDADPDGNLEPTSVTIVSGPASGTATVDPATGQITYTPNADFNGGDSLVYQICDTGTPVYCAPATLTFTVDPVNDAPVSAPDTLATAEDAPATVSVLANDTDVDGNIDPSTVTVVSGPTSGTTTVDPATGDVTYTPDADTNGTDSFTYQVCDTAGVCTTGTVDVTVAPVPDPPVAAGDSAGVPEDGAVVIDVAANDTDPDGDLDPTSVAVVSGPADGSVVVDAATGAVTYTPTPDFNGTDTFIYQICDAAGACTTGSVTIAVAPTPDPPVAVPDTALTAEDTAVIIDVAGNDSDPDGDLDPASVTIVSGPAGGTATVDAAGTVVYTPAPNFNGDDSFTYRICDAAGACTTAPVAVTVGAVDDAPVVSADSASLAEDGSVTIDVLANDFDPEDNLDPATLSILTDAAHGTATVDPATGLVVYTPRADFNGTDTFTYQVCDTDGLCSTGTVTVSVTPENDIPIPNDDTATVTEGGAVGIDVTRNDVDVDGDLDPSTVTVTSGPANGTVSVDPATGVVTYTAGGDFNGTDSFTYEVCDAAGACGTASVTVEVTPVSDVPVARPDSASVAEDSVAVIDILANDSDADGDLDPTSAAVVAGPANGTVTLDPDTGVATYTPALHFHGTDTFTYRVCDAAGACATASVTVEVVSVGDRPVVRSDTAATAEDTAVAVDVVANDTDADGDLDPSTVTVISAPADGTTSVDPTTGAVTYTPAPDFNGPDTFTYQVCDAQGLCATGTVNVTVGAVPDPPVARPDSAGTAEDTPVAIDVLANDTDADGDLDPGAVEIVTPPTNGAVAVDPSTGVVTYTPALDFNGLDSFTYQVCDATSACTTASVEVEVVSAADAPVVAGDTATVAEDTAVVIDVVANDSDPDGDLDPSTVTILSPPTQGTVAVDPATGAVTYTPEADYNGPDSFTYQICDRGSPALCGTGVVDVTVDPVPDAPVARDDGGATAEDQAVVVPLLGNDTDADGDLDPATLTLSGGPGRGTVTLDPATGTATYVPETDFNGTDSFTYQVCDVAGACAGATVTVVVAAVEDRPRAVADRVVTAEDAAVVVDVLANDTDAEGNLDPSSVEVVSGPAHGVVAVNPVSGQVTYTPAPDFSGTDTFTYQVCDAADPPLCDTATVTVAVTAVADRPVARPDRTTTVEDRPVHIDLLANDDDADGDLDPASVRVIGAPSHGSVTVNPDTGVALYTPEADFHGTDVFTYRVCDTTGLCATAEATIVLTPENDGPVAVDDAVAGSGGRPVEVDPVANDSDIDGDLDPTSVSVIRRPAWGAVTVDPITGRIFYIPAAGFTGQDRFTYQICDRAGACATAVVEMSIGEEPLPDGQRPLPVTGAQAGRQVLCGLLLLVVGSLLRPAGRARRRRPTGP